MSNSPSSRAIIHSFNSILPTVMYVAEPLRVPSSRRLERECQRNIELVWLTGQLAPDFKTIADFRKDNGIERRFRELRVYRTFSGDCSAFASCAERFVRTDEHEIFQMLN
jgi:hypothetical protein